MYPCIICFEYAFFLPGPPRISHESPFFTSFQLRSPGREPSGLRFSKLDCCLKAADSIVAYIHFYRGRTKCRQYNCSKRDRAPQSHPEPHPSLVPRRYRAVAHCARRQGATKLLPIYGDLQMFRPSWVKNSSRGHRIHGNCFRCRI
jgi:hypothetical protein